MTDLRTLALAATPGPWDLLNRGPAHDFDRYHIVVAQGHPGNVAKAEYADAAYIAAASPAVVLALLDVVEAATDIVDALPLPLRHASDGQLVIDTLTTRSRVVVALRAALARASEVMGE